MNRALARLVFCSAITWSGCSDHHELSVDASAAGDSATADAAASDATVQDAASQDASKDGAADGSFCARVLCGPGTECCEATRACEPVGSGCPPSQDGGLRCDTIRCAEGLTCCESTGQCYDPRCLSCCMARP